MASRTQDSPFRRLAAAIRSVAIHVLDHLATSESDPTSWERVEYSAGQKGTAPRKLDRLLDDAWRDGLHGSTKPALVVYGEELDDAALDDAPEGAVIAVVDPLDGTSNWTSLGLGSAMSVVVYRKLRRELVYVGVHIIQVGWRRHWWAEPTATWRGSIDALIEADELVVSPREVWPIKQSDLFVAGVGSATGETRDFLNYLTSTGGFRTVTLGGTPLGPELLDRELYALVECKETTVFDSAHLMLMANTDAVVGRLDGTRLNARQLREMFLRVSLAKDTVIDPHIVCKDRTGFESLAAAYGRMRQDRNDEKR